MNKLQATLSSFQGELLLPLNYRTPMASKIEMIPTEGYMYIIAHVDKTHVHIPAINKSFAKEQLLKLCTKYAKMPLFLFLVKFIQKDKVLLAECKQHRLGYDHTKFTKQKSIASQPLLDKQREALFIIKTLRKKKDFVHLREFIKSSKNNKNN